MKIAFLNQTEKKANDALYSSTKQSTIGRSLLLWQEIRETWAAVD